MNPVKKIQLPVWSWTGILRAWSPAAEMLCQVAAQTLKTFYNQHRDVTGLYENSRAVIFIFYRKSDGWALLVLNHSQSPTSPQPTSNRMKQNQIGPLRGGKYSNWVWLSEPLQYGVQCSVENDILLFPYFLSELLIKLLQTVILSVKVTALSSCSCCPTRGDTDGHLTCSIIVGPG